MTRDELEVEIKRATARAAKRTEEARDILWDRCLALESEKVDLMEALEGLASCAGRFLGSSIDFLDLPAHSPMLEQQVYKARRLLRLTKEEKAQWT